jgi:hypothetical protein
VRTRSQRVPLTYLILVKTLCKVVIFRTNCRSHGQLLPSALLTPGLTEELGEPSTGSAIEPLTIVILCTPLWGFHAAT